MSFLSIDMLGGIRWKTKVLQNRVDAGNQKVVVFF